jgi:Na+/H+ antiporter NhaD/arsenite permease-like protein
MANTIYTVFLVFSFLSLPLSSCFQQEKNAKISQQARLLFQLSAIIIFFFFFFFFLNPLYIDGFFYKSTHLIS